MTIYILHALYHYTKPANLVGDTGFEPIPPESKADVLPLHQSPLLLGNKILPITSVPSS